MACRVVADESNQLLGKQVRAVVHRFVRDGRERRCCCVVEVEGCIVPAPPARGGVIPEFLVPCVVAVVRVETAGLRRVLLHMKAQMPLTDGVGLVASVLHVLRPQSLVEWHSLRYRVRNHTVLQANVCTIPCMRVRLSMSVRGEGAATGAATGRWLALRIG